MIHIKIYIDIDIFVRDFHNSLQYQWAWFAIEYYKRFVSLILHQLVIGWIGKAHGPTILIDKSERKSN